MHDSMNGVEVHEWGPQLVKNLARRSITDLLVSQLYPGTSESLDDDCC